MANRSNQMRQRTAWKVIAAVLLGLTNSAAGQATGSSTPAQLVQRQIDAWNRHDAEAFAASYSDTTRLYVFPDKLTQRFSTRQELQRYYADLFVRHPKVHCDIAGQVAVGSTVVLAEKVTGRSDGRVIESLVTYKIDGGKIARVYFDYRP